MTQQPKNTTEERIALSFSKALMYELGREGFLRMVEEHDSEIDPSVCASHNYCDANEVMIDAYSQEMQKKDPQVTDPTFMSLVDKAWAIAKEKRFFAEVLTDVGTLSFVIEAEDIPVFKEGGYEDVWADIEYDPEGDEAKITGLRNKAEEDIPFDQLTNGGAQALLEMGERVGRQKHQDELEEN